MLPLREAIAAERRRRCGASLRRYVRALANPAWPPWPRSEDLRYRDWVQAHWSALALDRFDALWQIDERVERLQLEVLAQDLLDCADDLSGLARRLADEGYKVWGPSFDGQWRAWIERRWPSESAAALRGALKSAERTLAWVGAHREELRERDRCELARLEALQRNDLSAEELKPFLSYRLLGRVDSSR